MMLLEVATGEFKYSKDVSKQNGGVHRSKYYNDMS